MGKREGESEDEGNHVARTDQWPVIAVAMQRERERRESGGEEEQVSSRRRRSCS